MALSAFVGVLRINQGVIVHAALFERLDLPRRKRIFRACINQVFDRVVPPAAVAAHVDDDAGRLRSGGELARIEPLQKIRVALERRNGVFEVRPGDIAKGRVEDLVVDRLDSASPQSNGSSSG